MVKCWMTQVLQLCNYSKEIHSTFLTWKIGCIAVQTFCILISTSHSTLAVYQRLNSIFIKNKKYRSINAMTVHAARVKMGYSVSVSDGISNQSS
jgi:hypothetical protein